MNPIFTSSLKFTGPKQHALSMKKSLLSLLGRASSAKASASFFSLLAVCPKNPMRLQKSTFLNLIVSALLLGSVSLGSAATINWGGITGTTISGTSDVITTGTALKAFNLGGDPTTINGVSFAKASSVPGNNTFGTGEGALTVTSGAGSVFATFNAYGSSAAPFTSLPSGYQSLLNSGLYMSSAAAATATISGLSFGQEYLVQFWVNDSRTNGAGQSITFTSGNLVSADLNSTDANGGLGQFVTGIFSADITGTQVITLGQVGSGGHEIQLNGYQIRAIPEPGTVVLLGLGLGISLIFRRRRS